MARANAGAGIAMEVLVEKHEVLPMGIVVEFLGATVDRPTAGCIPQEGATQTLSKFMGNVHQRHELP